MPKNLCLSFKNPRSAKAKRGAPSNKRSRLAVVPNVDVTAQRKSTRVMKPPPKPPKEKKRSVPEPDSNCDDPSTPKKMRRSQPDTTNQSPPPILSHSPGNRYSDSNRNENPSLPDLHTLLDNVKEFNNLNPPNNDSVLALNALPHTKAHESRINQVLDNYVNCLACYKNKWANLLTLERFDGPGNIVKAPKILIAIGGEKSNTKTQLANLSLIDWMAITKKKSMKPRNDGGKLKMSGTPYYQPSTQNQRLRTFFGTAQRVFNWQYQLSDFNFNSGLTGFIDKLYTKRKKEFRKVMLIIFFFSK